MLNTLHEWLFKWRLLINQDKTKIIHFRPVAVQKAHFDFKCGELVLEKGSTYKYLGLWFHEHLDMKLAVKEQTKSASRALSALYTKLLNVCGKDYDVFCKLYESFVEAVLLYGAGLCGLSEQKRVNRVQNKVCRYFWALLKTLQTLHHGVTWVGLVVPMSRR